MGYTHYWYRPEVLEEQPFHAFTEDVQNLLDRLPKHSLSAGGYHADDPLVIRGWDGKGKPKVTEEFVSFNGDGTRERNLDHETCVIPQIFEPEEWEHPHSERNNGYFQCCKTARKPYDLVVCAVLLALKHHFPEVVILSDGEAEEWAEAVRWYCETLGHLLPPAQGPWNEKTA